MPAIKEVSQRVGDSAKVIKIDIDKNQKLANKLNIRSVPTLMIYKEGKVMWRQTGGMSAKQLERAITEFVDN
jgi:thioredoxin 1